MPGSTLNGITEQTGSTAAAKRNHQGQRNQNIPTVHGKDHANRNVRVQHHHPPIGCVGNGIVESRRIVPNHHHLFFTGFTGSAWSPRTSRNAATNTMSSHRCEQPERGASTERIITERTDDVIHHPTKNHAV
jgi:hypothetical protein